MSSRPDDALDVVVVIPSFNQRELLAECLASVEAEFARTDCRGRIVVVDNASWDDSANLVATRFPDVTLIENEVNVGFARACNQGGKLYQARYILLLNNDATLTAGALGAALSFADGRPDVGALTGRLLAPSGKERYPARYPWQRWYPPRPRIHPLSWVPGTCVLLRREALERVGWLDEAFFFYNEDLDLSIRLVRAGWALYYHPDVGVTHHESGSSQLIKPRAMLEGYRGTLLLAHKHYGPLAYGLTRWGLRLEVKARLAHAGMLQRLRPDDPALAGRVEAYQAIREVLRLGVVPSARDGVGAQHEG